MSLGHLSLKFSENYLFPCLHSCNALWSVYCDTSFAELDWTCLSFYFLSNSWLLQAVVTSAQHVTEQHLAHAQESFVDWICPLKVEAVTKRAAENWQVCRLWKPREPSSNMAAPHACWVTQDRSSCLSTSVSSFVTWGQAHRVLHRAVVKSVKMGVWPGHLFCKPWINISC